MDAFVRTSWPWSLFARAKAATVKVESGFPGGNVAAARMVSPHHLQFAAAAHESPRPLWFYFRVRQAPGPHLWCELMNADECLGPPPGWRNARPVYSSDGRNWRRIEAGQYDQLRGRFRFPVPVTGGEVWVAYCYPYLLADLTAFLARLPAPGLVTELCRSEGGRSVPYVRLGNHATPRRAVWVIARQHAGETPASFTVEGLLDGLLECLPESSTVEGGPEAPAMGDTAFHIVPMVDVDGVETGRFGKDRPPVDFNRDWREAPFHPATRAMMAQIQSSHAQAPVELVLDLHAPHHGDPACYFFGNGPEWMTPEGSETVSRFLSLLTREAPVSVGFSPTDLRISTPPVDSARYFLANELAVPVLTLEMSYHQAQSGNYLEPEDYRAFGAGLGRIIACLLFEGRVH